MRFVGLRPPIVLVAPLVALLLALAALVAACEAEEGGGPSAIPCASQADCPAGTVCAGSVCLPPADVNCLDPGVGCPEGYLCLSTGRCKRGAECESDADCCDGGAACGRQCRDSVCVGSDCATGETQPCFVGCHQGRRPCERGVWGACDAPPVTGTETCHDRIDNDCNGQTDEGCADCVKEERRPCQTECGSGEQVCQVDGTWGPCSAPSDCTCQPGETLTEPCGNCGFEEATCGGDNTWTWSGLCQGEGECAAETEDVRDCGRCGVQVRTCSADCAWGEWGDCSDEGVCEPGDAEEQACGQCGARVRTCGDDCAWSAWGDCVEGGGCQQGEQQVQSCGQCGVRVSVCDANCQWGPFGACQDEGECAPGTNQTEACGFCGQRSRTCGDNCAWGAWGACDDGGECAPGDEESETCGPDTERGICEFGSRYRTCGSACRWNPWSDCAGAVYPGWEICGNGIDEDCDGSDPDAPDGYEPNDTCGGCADLGEDPEITLYGSFDTVADQDDYYCFTAHDSGFNPLENIEVTLTGQPAGADADLYLFKGQTACVAGHPVLASATTVGGGDETLSWSEGVMDDDAGVYVLLVRNYGSSSCYQEYELTIDGLN